MTNKTYLKEPRMPGMSFEPVDKEPYRNARLFSESTREIWDTRKQQQKTVRKIRRNAV